MESHKTFLQSSGHFQLDTNMKPRRTEVHIYLSALLIFLAGTALAQSAPKRVTIAQLTADPGRYLGHELDIARGYCVQGGVKLMPSGYVCSTDGDVWIAARILSPRSAKMKIDANCGGIDAIEHSSFCAARITFTPSSMDKANTEVEPTKQVLLLYAPNVTLRF